MPSAMFFDLVAPLVDANEGWKTKEQALEMIEELAKDGRVQFVEQPMPAATSAKDLGLA